MYGESDDGACGADECLGTRSHASPTVITARPFSSQSLPPCDMCATDPVFGTEEAILVHLKQAATPRKSSRAFPSRFEVMKPRVTYRPHCPSFQVWSGDEEAAVGVCWFAVCGSTSWRLAVHVVTSWYPVRRKRRSCVSWQAGRGRRVRHVHTFRSLRFERSGPYITYRPRGPSL